MREGPSDRRANGRQAESELGSHFTRNALKQPDLRLPAAFFRSLLDQSAGFTGEVARLHLACEPVVGSGAWLWYREIRR